MCQVRRQLLKVQHRWGEKRPAEMERQAEGPGTLRAERDRIEAEARRRYLARGGDPDHGEQFWNKTLWPRNPR